MPQKINLGPSYDEILSTIASLTPQEFENKICAYRISETLLLHWIQANDFELILQSILAQNHQLMVHLFQKLPVNLKKMLFLRNYEFLTVSIEQLNPRIFDYLFQKLSMDEQHNFLAKHGINLYQNAFVKNKPHLLRKIFTIDSPHITKYLSHEPQSILTQVSQNHGAEFLTIVFASASKKAYFEFLKTNHNHYLKTLISTNQPELIQLLFRHLPNFFSDLTQAERLDLFIFISLHASQSSFHALSYFIQESHLTEIFQYINPAFIDELELKHQSHILEFLLLASTNFEQFRIIYQALSGISRASARLMYHAYKPLAQVYAFLGGLMNNYTIVPDEIDMLINVYPYVKPEKQLAIISCFLMPNSFLERDLLFSQHALDLIAKDSIKLLASDDRHPIHPFFPAVVNYYLPILKHKYSNTRLQGKFLLNYSIALIEGIADFKHQDLVLFTDNPGFLNRFMTQLIHCKSHKIYKSIRQESEEQAEQVFSL